MIDRQCRRCGCTDIAACLHDDGTPCCWYEEDLCSKCADRLAELPQELTDILSAIVDENLFVSPGEPGGYAACLRLAHFKPELADRAAELLEEAEYL